MRITSVDFANEEKTTKEFQPQQYSLPTNSTLCTDVSQSIEDSSDNANESFIENNQNFIFDGELLTLRVLFIDILFLICALISDFVQATSILSKNMETHKGINEDLRFAIAAYALIWIPGIPAAIHFLSVFRHRLIWYKSLLTAFLIFLFYPIIPIIAKLILIWIRPRDNKITKEYMEAEYGATVAYAIHGCISGPLQLCYQSWLVLNGIVDMVFENMTLDLAEFEWANNGGNITWPSTTFCLIFSILT